MSEVGFKHTSVWRSNVRTHSLPRFLPKSFQGGELGPWGGRWPQDILMFGSSQNAFMASLSFEPGKVACLTAPQSRFYTTATDPFHVLPSPLTPNPTERVPFPWMWLGSGSSNGWRCSVTGISGFLGVSRRFEKAEWWAGQWAG